MADRPLFDPARIRGPSETAPTGRPVLSVSQALELIRGVIARYLPGTLLVAGEIGDYSRAASGHIYFTLKDAAGELRVVMWRTSAAKLKFSLQSGLEVICAGGIEVYSPRGSVQLVATRIDPRGVGALELALRQLREKLEREGLLDPARKRPLPSIAFRVAVVTSLQGAVLRDICQTLARRNPAVEVLVYPVRVQGDGAAAEIARAIRQISDAADRLSLDVVIVGRGGGSLEDLWAFQEEIVARAIVACTIPVISAVGHETDVSVSDLVADLRAATPTAAAELVSPPASALMQALRDLVRRAGRVAGHRQSILHQRLARCERSPFLSRPLAAVRLRSQRIDELERAWTHHVRMLHRNLRERVARSEIALSRSGAPRRFQIASRKAESLFERAARAALRSIHLRARQAAHLQHRLLWRSPRTLIMIQQEHARDLARRNAAAIQRLHEQRLAALRMHDAAIVALDPKGVLARGYSITRDVVSGKVIRRPSDVRPGDRISTDTNEGGFTSRVEDSQQKRLFD